MKETWKSVVGYEDLYLISSNGRVKRNKKLLKPGLAGNGYFTVALCRDGIAKSHTIHTMVAIAFIGKRSLNKQVNHKDGLKTNNNVINLEYSTNRENSIHAVINGLNPSGEKCYWAKLNKKQIDMIRKEHVPYKITYEYLSKKYGVSSSAISLIVRGERWKKYA